MSDDYDVTWLALESAARSVGMVKYGVTTAEPFHTLIPFLERYYQEGRATGFEHPMSALRWDPRTLLPDAKSIIAVAVPYQTEKGRQLQHPQGRMGIVSRYAWGQDYHLVMKTQLQQLASQIANIAGREVQSLVCVDTSPLVDRAIALRAGIGWIGKNALLITKEYGSYVFLGALLVDVTVAPAPVDEPVMDDCGECTLCMQACPTNALIEGGVLDGKKCLSGITQIKGLIPETYRSKIGRRIWGCDTCQTVCPKNRATLVSMVNVFDPDPALSFPDLKALLQLSGRQFKERYGHTAAAWRGHQVIRRNAIIALANANDQSAVPELIELLGDPRSEIRGTAAWALQRLNPEHSRHAVHLAWQAESEETARQEMRWAQDL